MGWGMTRGEKAANGQQVRGLLRGIRCNRLGMGVGHAVVLAFGLATLAFGLYLLVAAYYPVVPTVAALIIGLILVLIGVAETFTEAEFDRAGRRKP